jgi:nucleoid DNA-binding protein
MENKKPKTKRWNRWEKDEKKPVYRELTKEEKERLRQEQQRQIGNATEKKPEEQPTPKWEPRGWEPKKLNRERIANLIAWHLREDPKLKKLAEELSHKLLQKILPELTAKIIAQMVEIIHREVLKGKTIEIRGLATWRTRNGKIKVKNHIKPKPPTQP